MSEGKNVAQRGQTTSQRTHSQNVEGLSRHYEMKGPCGQLGSFCLVFNTGCFVFNENMAPLISSKLCLSLPITGTALSLKELDSG